MIVQPKIRGFICTTAHPAGCAKNVDEQIQHVLKGGPVEGGPKKVLVIGSSTGYGLASRITAAFGSNAATLGVFFEKPSDGKRTATAGWYNTCAFEKAARAKGLYARSINGDAFSDDLKNQVCAIIAQDMGQVDLVIYSLASPRRVHPKTGEVFKSTLKPITGSYTNKSFDFDKSEVTEVSLEQAVPEDVRQTIAVMGGEDWQMWIDLLESKNFWRPKRSAWRIPISARISPSPFTVRAPSARPRTIWKKPLTTWIKKCKSSAAARLFRLTRRW